MIDLTNGQLNKEFEFAKSIKDDSLLECITRLRQRDEMSGTETKLMNDFAPHSFYFERFLGDQFRGNGGVIFHGSHDGYGSGGAPTFSVCLTPTTGWSIHT